ncbi:hypothetical protein HGRIS_011559 [Hohenbuehelia grisea]|uniref:Cytochrome P450 monooxygenase n=1 Tax=Hohenbuehelia grisea TaxID=104357 RepID=A0ABR3JXQ0_9AGAR
MIVDTALSITSHIDLRTAAFLAGLAVVAVHVVPWFLDPHGIRLYPGPFLAKFTDLWLGWVSAHGHRSEVVHHMHQKYGPIVRLAPNHVSIAEPDALPIVYAHGNGALKSEFYDAFVSIQRGVFNTRNRADHARKRKIVSHVFSQKSVLEFEPHIREYVSQLLTRWDTMVEKVKNASPSERVGGEEGEGWEGREGRVWLDCLPCDLAFGAPFGMLRAGADSAPVPATKEGAEAVMAAYGQGLGAEEASKVAIKHIPAVQILNGRGEYSMSMGVLPPHWRPIAKQLPWFKKGSKDVQALAGIAIMAVAKRLAEDKKVAQSERRSDLLSKLQQGKDDQGNPMGREELTAEALTLLIAGSDTTSNSTCAIIYYLASHPTAQAKLQAELDEHMGTEDELVATFAQIRRLTQHAAEEGSQPSTPSKEYSTEAKAFSLKDNDLSAPKGAKDTPPTIPYLDACINESLRLHSTSALGLPRVIPEGGLTVLGQHFPAGTVLSVPSYTIHRDPSVWGEDVDEFRPERWYEGDVGKMMRTFNPFSFGPRACVGRNLAYLELQIIVASILRRYNFVLENPDQPGTILYRPAREHHGFAHLATYPAIRRSMASQSQVSTSPSPTTSSPPSVPPGSGDNNPGGFFSPSGSPPLILAFLAIGLFSAAMIGVFGWRRLHFGRGNWMVAPVGVRGGPGGAGSARRGQRALGEKPKLVDLWTERGATRGGWDGARVDDMRWSDITVSRDSVLAQYS